MFTYSSSQVEGQQTLREAYSASSHNKGVGVENGYDDSAKPVAAAACNDR